MNDRATEYFGEDRGKSDKAFRVVPAGPDYAPIDARDRIIEDNDLDFGARVMFVRILDLSTRAADRDDYGVITISQNKLAHKFGVSLRTIWNWKQQLLQKGVIWMTKRFMPNAWPMDTYHITELDPPGKTEGRTTKDGMWGNGARRQSPGQAGLGAREPGQTIIPGTGNRSNRFHSETDFQNGEKSSFLPANATGNRNQLPVAPETDCHGEPKQIAAANGNGLPAGAETGCEPPPKQIAAANSNGLPLPAERGCEHKQSKSVGNSVSKVGGEALPTEKQFQTWLKSLDGMFPSRLKELEKAFMKKIAFANSPEAKKEWKRRLNIVQERLLGGPVKDEPAKPVRTEKKASIPFEEQKRQWEAAKKNLPPSLQQKAAGKAAARTKKFYRGQ